MQMKSVDLTFPSPASPFYMLPIVILQLKQKQEGGYAKSFMCFI